MTDLISLQDYKDAVGKTSPDEDTQLSSIIASVSQLVKTYCNNSFVDHYSTPTTETFTVMHPTKELFLKHTPVVNISTVEVRTTYASGYETITEGANEYYLNPANDSIMRTGSSGFKTWPLGPGSVRVTYTGGYAEVPLDLRLALVDLVEYYKNNEQKPRRSSGASHQENAGANSLGSPDFPDHIKRVMELYRNIE